jgi:hypothetical protein
MTIHIPHRCRVCDNLSETVLDHMPPLDDELRWILGRPNFTLGPMAHLFRTAGHDIPKRAEDEQAYMLHWMLNHYFKHGAAGWRAAADEEVTQLCEVAKAKVKSNG